MEPYANILVCNRSVCRAGSTTTGSRAHCHCYCLLPTRCRRLVSQPAIIPTCPRAENSLPSRVSTAAARAPRPRSWRVPCARMASMSPSPANRAAPPRARRIREVLLHSATAGLSPLTEMALMFASRAQHVHEVILPALAEGRIVLCDRFTDSTEAYQGGGRKLGIERRCSRCTKSSAVTCSPTSRSLLDNEVAFSVERARRRNRKHKGVRSERGPERDENRFEQENRAFFGRVRHAYLAIAAREPRASAPRKRPRHAQRNACGYHGVGAEKD